MMEEQPDEWEVAEAEALASARAAIRSAMAAAGIGQIELARRLGVGSTSVSHLLNSKDGMTLRSFARALIACGVEPDFQIRENEPEPAEVEPGS